MPTFRLKEGHGAVDLFATAASYGSMHVKPGQTVEVPGSLVTSRPEPEEPKEGEEPPPALPPLPEDAYLVENRGEERAWPKAMWELVEQPALKAAKSADKSAASAAVKES